ncbi:MAG TPA: hypothetical protein VGD43_09705 [Micromonospora sp.]
MFPVALLARPGARYVLADQAPEARSHQALSQVAGSYTAVAWLSLVLVLGSVLIALITLRWTLQAHDGPAPRPVSGWWVLAGVGFLGYLGHLWTSVGEPTIGTAYLVDAAARPTPLQVAQLVDAATRWPYPEVGLPGLALAVAWSLAHIRLVLATRARVGENTGP